MSLRDYLPIKRRAPSSHEQATKKVKVDSEERGKNSEETVAPAVTVKQPATPAVTVKQPVTPAVTVKQPATPARTVKQPATPPKSPQKEPDVQPQLNRFKSFTVESPKKSFTVESPKKKSQPPAYQRYANLVTQNELTLPDNYKLLGEKFRCTDTVVNMLQKRKEVCTLSKLKKAVQDMMRRMFEQRNLAQMKTVFPSAFVFRQEKGIPGTYADIREKEQYHLTIECGGVGEGKWLDSAALVERMQTFRNGLLLIITNHHKLFLKSRNIDIPDEKVVRWHPEFDLDGVPDVEEAELPKPPFKESYSTAKEVLAAAHHRFASKLQRALANSSVQSCDDDKVAVVTPHPPNPPTTPAPPPPPQVDPTLVGISPLLLERIRQKEAARATAVITRDPAVEKKLHMLQKLPEMCRILKTFFVSEQKVALFLDDVVQKVSESAGDSKDAVEEHLKLLREVSPEWITLVTIRKRDYLKIDKGVDMKTIFSALEQKRKQVSNE